MYKIGKKYMGTLFFIGTATSARAYSTMWPNHESCNGFILPPAIYSYITRSNSISSKSDILLRSVKINFIINEIAIRDHVDCFCRHWLRARDCTSLDFNIWNMSDVFQNLRDLRPNNISQARLWIMALQPWLPQILSCLNLSVMQRVEHGALDMDIILIRKWYLIFW